MLNNKLLKIQKIIKTNHQGSILLLAMLIMTGSLVTGLAIGNIIISEVRQSRNIDDAITAYYLAESGLEQSVYLYRKDNATFNLNIDSINPGDPAPTNPSDCYFDAVNLSGNCNAYTQESPSTSLTILPNSVQQVNFFNEDLTTGYPIESIEIDWLDANADNAIEPWLEMEVIELTSNFLTASNYPVIFVQKCGAGPVCTPIDSSTYSVAANYFDPNQNYIIRLRALYDTVKVTVTAYDGISGTGSITATKAVDIFTTGEFRTSQQSLKATLATGVTTTKPFVDFVLFSECDLVKGIGLSSSCP